MSLVRTIVCLAGNPDDPPKKPSPVGRHAIVMPKLEGIPKLLLEDMQENDKLKVVNATRELENILRDYQNPYFKRNRQQAYSMGAHSFLLLIMRKWRHNEDIQASSFCCLVFIMDACPQATEVFSHLGGLEVAITALNLFPFSNRVQGYVSEMLAIVFKGAAVSNTATVLDNYHNTMERFVEEFDGVKLIVAAMAIFPDDSFVQSSGCYLLSQLAGHEPFRTALQTAGALTAVSAAMEKHGNNKETSVREHVFTFWKNFAW